MQKIVISQLFLILTLLSGRAIENEIGINIGLNSTQNESRFKLKNPTIGVTYQDNRYMVMPRVDLEYTNVKGDYANSLLKGSVNAVYEYENRTYTIPYALVGLGYEYVSGGTKDIFESHPFVQAGVGVRVDLEQGYKARLEGKMLQVLANSKEGNEAILTAGISMPLPYKASIQKRPKVVKRVKAVRQPKIVVQRVKVVSSPNIIYHPPQAPKPKIVYVKNNECPIKIDKPDFDRDGVEDRLDQCPSTPCNFSVDHYGCPIKTTLKINFKTNSAKIEGYSINKIENFANFLLKNRGSVVKIVGHTDSRGSSKHNMKLSLARANSVMRALLSRGVSRLRLSTEGKGESQPIAPNTTAEGRAMNRRIEAILSYPNGRRKR